MEKISEFGKERKENQNQHHLLVSSSHNVQGYKIQFSINEQSIVAQLVYVDVQEGSTSHGFNSQKFANKRFFKGLVNIRI